MSGENDRSKRVETSVHVYRLRLAPATGGAAVFAWDYPGSTLLRVRILRARVEPDLAGEPAGAAEVPGASEAPSGGARPEPPAESPPDPEPGPHTCWQIVYEGDTGSFRDRDLPAASAWRYAVFARDGDGPWILWRDEVVMVP